MVSFQAPVTPYTGLNPVFNGFQSPPKKAPAPEKNFLFLFQCCTGLFKCSGFNLKVKGLIQLEVNFMLWLLMNIGIHIIHIQLSSSFKREELARCCFPLIYCNVQAVCKSHMLASLQYISPQWLSLKIHSFNNGCLGDIHKQWSHPLQGTSLDTTYFPPTK